MVCGALFPGRDPGYWKSTPQVSEKVELMLVTVEGPGNIKLILTLGVFRTKQEKGRSQKRRICNRSYRHSFYLDSVFRFTSSILVAVTFKIRKT